LAVFVHLLADDDTILAQHDGLNVSTDSWYPGDIIVQVHSINITPDSLADTRWAAVGMYRTDTYERLPISLNMNTEQVSDRILIEIGAIPP
jgi:hypothetical protein